MKLLDNTTISFIVGTKLAFRYFKQNNPQGGIIINTASITAVYPVFTYGIYNAAKAGVRKI